MTHHSYDNCEALLGSLSEYIDEDLTPELCLEVERHLAGCEDCRAVLNTTRRTIDLVRESDEGVPEGVRERLFKRLNLDDYLKQGEPSR
jgi:anti-sigma factor (TIGR02949 family)